MRYLLGMVLRGARWLGFLSLGSVLVGACGGSSLPQVVSADGGSSEVPRADAASAAPCPLEAALREISTEEAHGEVLQRLDVPYDGATREVLLLRLPTADGRETFAEWIPPLEKTKRPAVLVTVPYDGIDWSGRDVDARFSRACATPPCFVKDTDGPGAGPDVGGISYSRTSPLEMVEQSRVHLAHGAGVLAVFGRFYAGGSFFQYAQAMVAGLRFLGTDARVDTEAIGVIGGSLGGYESFYAAAYAPAAVAPKAVVAEFPPVDLEREVAWLTVKEPARAKTSKRKDEIRLFADPYLRRAAVDTGDRGAGGDYRCFSPDFVVPRVKGDVLVTVDDWDLLVDPELAPPLLEKLGSKGHGLFYRHTSAPDVDALQLDHGPFDQLPSKASSPLPSRITFSTVFLHLRIGKGVVYAPFDAATMQAFLERLRDQSRAGITQPGAAERLAELADARVQFFDVATGKTAPGPDSVSTAVAAVWGVQIPANEIQTYLRKTGLPP